MSRGLSRPWGPVAAIVAVGLVVAVIGGRSSGDTAWGGAAGSGRSATPGEAETALATGVVDARTIELAGGDTLRFIGLETPEANECYGREARARTEQLLPPGTPVRLEYDLERRDDGGRILAYVYRLDDDLFVNLALARDGFARESIASPNLAHVAELVAAVAEAEATGRGLWGACASPTTTRPRATTTVRAAGRVVDIAADGAVDGECGCEA